MQVRWVDQTQYPEDTIESFVGQSSMGLLCPPATLETENLGTQVVHTHTHQKYIYIYCLDPERQIHVLNLNPKPETLNLKTQNLIPKS